MKPKVDLDQSGPLGEWFARAVDAAGPVTFSEVRRHDEGFSWQTYTLRVAWTGADGGEHDGAFAIRREPEDGLVAPYDIVGQYALHQHLERHGRFPIPRLRWLELDTSVMGMPFYVMDRVDGIVPVQFKVGGNGPFADDEARFAVGREFVDVLAEIHAVDPTGLDAHIRRSATPADAPADAIGYWEAEYASAARPRIPVVEALISWLHHNPVTSGRLALCHGDYRIGNFILGADGHIAAILDWELAEVTDPVADIAWAAHPLYRGRSPLWSQLLPREEFLARYADRTGLVVEPDVLRFWTMLAYLKIAVHYAKAARAFRDGRTDDLRLAAMGHQVIYVARLIRDELQANRTPA